MATKVDKSNEVNRIADEMFKMTKDELFNYIINLKIYQKIFEEETESHIEETIKAYINYCDETYRLIVRDAAYNIVYIDELLE